jgi:hypothetical protein
MKRILNVQKQIGTLGKNAKNPFFKSAYLDLTTLIEHVTPLLNEQGLVLLQPLSGDTVTSAIMDSETGEVIVSSSLTLPSISDPQKMGSCVTYFRRYTLKSLLAIAEVDDDGNLASKPTKTNLTADNAKHHASIKTSLETLKTMFNVTEEQGIKYNKLLNNGSK